MLKIIHTSDWHLGHELSAYSRVEEHKAFLARLRRLVEDERPDALVVSGDIFHSSIPSNASMALFADELDRIHSAAPTMKIVVTAGNHDSGSRLEIWRSPWRRLGAEMIGRVMRNDDGSVDFNRHIIVIGDDNNPKGIIVALPHIYQRAYPVIDEKIPGDDSDQRHRFMARLRSEIESTAQRLGSPGLDLPIVVSAHIAVTGSDTSAHDEIGGMEFVALDDFGLDYDYLALGHIHSRQTFNVGASNAIAHYCGTPVAVSFAEGPDHGATIVEIDRRGAVPRLRTVDFPTACPLVVFPPKEEPPLDFEEALKLLAGFDREAYLAVRVGIRDVAPPAANERAFDAASKGCARFCKFIWERPDSANADLSTIEELPDIESFKTLTPLEVAKDFYRRTNNAEMPPELVELFNEVVDAGKHAEDDRRS